MDLKPTRTFDEQIQWLREGHGLIIDDELSAKDILSRVNYYRLSAYGIGLKRKDNPEYFVDGISLIHLYHLYLFDTYLRNALLYILEQIEIELRTQIAYHLALAYGAEGYMDSANFVPVAKSSGQLVHTYVIQKFHEEIQRQRSLPCVKHHQEKYGGHFPIWAAVELFSFGMLSSLYSIMKPDVQKEVSRFYGLEVNRLVPWMASLVELRNRCAHYGRIYNMPFSRTPRLYSEYSKYQSNRLFPVVLIMGRMMNEKECWNTFCGTLIALAETYSEANLSFLGFPNNWKEILNQF